MDENGFYLYWTNQNKVINDIAFSSLSIHSDRISFLVLYKKTAYCSIYFLAYHQYFSVLSTFLHVLKQNNNGCNVDIIKTWGVFTIKKAHNHPIMISNFTGCMPIWHGIWQ